MGRVLEAVFTAREATEAGRLFTRVHVSAEDERELRDAVRAQIGTVGLEAAGERGSQAWRVFLRGHFCVRTGLVPVFDAERTRIE